MTRSPDFAREHRRSEAGAAGAGGEPSAPPAQRGAGVIAIGASAGGVEALRAVVAGLPPELPAAVLVVLHIPRHAPSALPGILDRSGPLPAVAARHGMPARPGTIYVAPAGYHLLIRNGHLELSVGPTENGHRPAIDPLFRSAAVAFGPGAIGVVLSGSRDDGAAGLTVIVERGGQAVVQDPDEALHRSMPANALEHSASAHVLPAAKIGALLGELVGEGAPPLPLPHPDPQLAAEDETAALRAMTSEAVPSARPSGLSCPSCQGVLFELDGEPAPRYRCRVGHAWSPGSLSDEQAVVVDQALWTALRTLEENAALSLRLAEVAEQHERRRAAAIYRQRYEASKAEATRLRKLINQISPTLHAPAPDGSDADES
ncbi:MAG: chemotaxis protein CheB [Pseudonocardiales bacterium]|nr:chemotaxis protein CheB [Pseudonocardiales bacterium]